MAVEIIQPTKFSFWFPCIAILTQQLASERTPLMLLMNYFREQTTAGWLSCGRTKWNTQLITLSQQIWHKCSNTQKLKKILFKHHLHDSSFGRMSSSGLLLWAPNYWSAIYEPQTIVLLFSFCYSWFCNQLFFSSISFPSFFGETNVWEKKKIWFMMFFSSKKDHEPNLFVLNFFLKSSLSLCWYFPSACFEFVWESACHCAAQAIFQRQEKLKNQNLPSHHLCFHSSFQSS